MLGRDTELYRKVDSIATAVAENNVTLASIQTAIEGSIELNDEKHRTCDNARKDLKRGIENLEKKEIKDIKDVHCRINKSMLTNTKLILLLAGIIVSLSIAVTGVVMSLRETRYIGELERMQLPGATFNEDGG